MAAIPSLLSRNLSIFSKILIWWIWNIVFGLIPLLVVSGIRISGISHKASAITTEEVKHLFNDGVIIFFCLAMIGAISVDIYLTRRHFKSHYSLWMAVIAVIIAASISILYLAFILTNEGNGEHFGNFVPLTIGLIIATLFYCTVGKISLFLKEKQ